MHRDLRLEARHHIVGAAQHAAQVCADVEPVLAGRRQMEQRVEGRHTLHVAGVQLKLVRDLGHRLRGEVPELLLRQVERGHHRGTGLREFGWKVTDLFEDVLRENRHLSTSPRTVSAVPMIAIMSAIMWLSAILSSAWRLTNDAERNFTRRGLCVPSLTM